MPMSSSFATLIKHCLKGKHKSNRTEYQALAVASTQPSCCEMPSIWWVSREDLSLHRTDIFNHHTCPSVLGIMQLCFAISSGIAILWTTGNVAICCNIVWFSLLQLCCKICLKRICQQQNFTQDSPRVSLLTWDRGQAICDEEDTTNHEQSRLKAGCRKIRTEMNLEQQMHTNATTSSYGKGNQQMVLYNDHNVVAFQCDLSIMLPKGAA